MLSEGMMLCKCWHNIVSNIVDGPEWRFYGASDSKSMRKYLTRCGMPVNQLLPESSVGSFISTRGKRSKSMYKVSKYQQWGGMPYKERTLLKVFQDISRLCKAADIPEMIIKAQRLVQKLYQLPRLHGVLIEKVLLRHVFILLVR